MDTALLLFPVAFVVFLIVLVVGTAMFFAADPFDFTNNIPTLVLFFGSLLLIGFLPVIAFLLLLKLKSLTLILLLSVFYLFAVLSLWPLKVMGQWLGPWSRWLIFYPSVALVLSVPGLAMIGGAQTTAFLFLLHQLIYLAVAAVLLMTRLFFLHDYEDDHAVHWHQLPIWMLGIIAVLSPLLLHFNQIENYVLVLLGVSGLLLGIVGLFLLEELFFGQKNLAWLFNVQSIVFGALAFSPSAMIALGAGQVGSPKPYLTAFLLLAGSNIWACRSVYISIGAYGLEVGLYYLAMGLAILLVIPITLQFGLYLDLHFLLILLQILLVVSAIALAILNIIFGNDASSGMQESGFAQHVGAHISSVFGASMGVAAEAVVNAVVSAGAVALPMVAGAVVAGVALSAISSPLGAVATQAQANVSNAVTASFPGGAAGLAQALSVSINPATTQGSTSLHTTASMTNMSSMRNASISTITGSSTATAAGSAKQQYQAFTARTSQDQTITGFATAGTTVADLEQQFQNIGIQNISNIILSRAFSSLTVPVNVPVPVAPNGSPIIYLIQAPGNIFYTFALTGEYTFQRTFNGTSSSILVSQTPNTSVNIITYNGGSVVGAFHNYTAIGTNIVVTSETPISHTSVPAAVLTADAALAAPAIGH
jgi:hypothetical protein